LFIQKQLLINGLSTNYRLKLNQCPIAIIINIVMIRADGKIMAREIISYYSQSGHNIFNLYKFNLDISTLLRHFNII